ncbi:hypothetical protein LB452_05770 [Psychroflexus sp. CAK8W]|uniref:PH domain-containing protein n=1 Tax=Psychroflexus longus TaxID=2873596 RepID=A0ABS7XIY8_9FLAO|nr:hypothetical protein [Psychroflexus longus]MBZ9778428.1 hypothetical protein [Psychroflexus longus]
MQRIHFDKLSVDWVRVTLLIASALCILIGYGMIFNYENGLISAFGFLIQIFILSRIFWYKNFVQWNKKGIVIKTNSFKSKTITFEDIKTTIPKKDVIKLELQSRSDKKIKLRNIHEDDINRLIRILVEHSHAKFIDQRSTVNSISTS